MDIDDLVDNIEEILPENLTLWKRNKIKELIDSYTIKQITKSITDYNQILDEIPNNES